MIRLPLEMHRVFLIACVTVTLGVLPASAQSSGDQSPGFLQGLFGGNGGDQNTRRDSGAQAPDSDLSVRIDRLEAQVRQMTGAIEDLQFRNQQLTDQLRRLQGDAGGQAQPQAVQQSPPQPGRQQAASQPPVTQPPQPGASLAIAAGTPPGAPGGRRGDAFDPTQNPNAPGVPRSLGSVSSGTGAAPANPPADQVAAQELPPPPGGRASGEPLNLGADTGYGSQGGAPAGDGRGTQVATLPPSDSPKDYFDLAYGYVMHKDYALAVDTFHAFLHKFPSDQRAPEAEFWLGESLYQKQQYRDAAEAFLNVSTKYESAPKAPDSLLRLGQSLALLGEKEAACASLGEVVRKYPRARVALKQEVDREQKRVGC